MVGNLPCTFSLGPAIIHVKPVETSYSFHTIETIFADQATCIKISNSSDKPIYFLDLEPVVYFDLGSIGYHEPTEPTKLIFSKQKYIPSYITAFNSMLNLSTTLSKPDCPQTMDTKDPYPWLESDDP